MIGKIKSFVIKIPLIRQIYAYFLGPKRYKYLFETITRKKARRIMEIGVWDGEHGLQMINAAKKVHGRDVEYYGFDLFEELDSDKFNSEIAKQPPSMKQVLKKLKKTGCKIRLFKGDTARTLPKYVIKLPMMDFIFIDGGHSIATISNDWRYSSQLMSKNTVVIFDDYWNREDAGCKKVIENIDRKRYNVKILPIQDRFKKNWGVLKINFVNVTKK
ncbi:class I SAM-dependent methyltransferase [Candidatus Woesearchaeota archaeon]|nr:class I SAM-dependent methyltransferase [Candidatus Woesearchaeota archaeon]